MIYSPHWHAAERPDTRVNPKRPDAGQKRVMKGGSFLCHESYCNRYRLGTHGQYAGFRHDQYRVSLRAGCLNTIEYRFRCGDCVGGEQLDTDRSHYVRRELSLASSAPMRLGGRFGARSAGQI